MYYQIKAKVLLQPPFWMIICHARICFMEFLIHETCLINNPNTFAVRILLIILLRAQSLRINLLHMVQWNLIKIKHFWYEIISISIRLIPILAYIAILTHTLNTNGPWILRISDEIVCTRWNRTYINVLDFTCLHLKWIETSLEWMKDAKTQSKWNGITQIKWNTTVGITAALWLLYWWGDGNLILRFQHANLLQFYIYAKRTTLAYM